MEFRGIRKDNGKWIEGYYVRHETRQACVIGDDKLSNYEIEHYIVMDSFADWNMPKTMQFYEVISETVGQYVGKSDANKIKIYDGDILNAGDRIVVVKWNMGCGCWDSDWIKYVGERTSNGVEFAEWDLRCEFIGNIHERSNDD